MADLQLSSCRAFIVVYRHRNPARASSARERLRWRFVAMEKNMRKNFCLLTIRAAVALVLAAIPTSMAVNPAASAGADSFDDSIMSNVTPPFVRPGLHESGASSGWNGAVFVGRGESIFGIRVGLIAGGSYITGDDVYWNANDVGPRAYDGSYARITFGKSPHNAIGKNKDLTLEWSVQGDNAILGSFSPSKDNTTIAIEAYFPWDYPGKYSFENEDTITGTAPGVLTDKEEWFPGEDKKSYFRLTVLEAPKDKGLYSSDDSMISAIQGHGGETGDRAGFMKYTLDKGEKVVFKASIENRPIAKWKDLSRESILQTIENARIAYQNRRFNGSGPIGKAAAAIIDAESWIESYQCNHNTKANYPRTYTPAGRRWVRGSWRTFAWDPMFQSAVISMEDPGAAYGTVLAALITRMESGINKGMVPDNYIGNVWGADGGFWNGSKPPVASYFVWKLYVKFHNKKFLESTYGHLAEWCEWWTKPGPDGRPMRDGNEDGLLEWGGGNPGWESGLDEQPMWEGWKRAGVHTDLTSVWLNSLRALDLRMMTKIARELGKTEAAEKYWSDYQEIKHRINEKLWREDVGMYSNRYWSGEWRSDENGYPLTFPNFFVTLLAKVPSKERATRMVEEHLLKNKEYWTGGYLVYESLRAYQFDRIAAEAAVKATKQWVDLWERRNWAVPSRGEANYQYRYQGWAMNAPLTGIHEMISVEPWDDCINDIRFGSLGLPGTNSLKNVRMQGHTYDITITPNETVLVRDGEKVFKATGGKVLVRSFRQDDHKVYFTIKTENEVDVTLYPPITPSRVEGTIPKGCANVYPPMTPSSTAVVVENGKLRYKPSEL